MNTTERENVLRQLLLELASLLGEVAESHWSAKSRTAVSTSTIDVDDVLSWYGGMGSLNDLIIARANGHAVERAKETLSNDKLDALRNKIYAEASRLRG